MRIIETKVYPFDELSEDAKDKAVENLYGINIDHDWWEFTFEDAKNVGIKITAFDLDRGSYCKGDIDDPVDTARAILKEHGDKCESWQTAKDFHDQVAKDGEETIGFKGLCSGFKYSILEDYRIILRKEYEHLTSEEAIVETIKANEYEFTEDGKIV